MENELVSMAQQFTGLPMNALIGAPLNAAAQANAAMAVTQTKFILDTCFGYQKTNDDKDIAYEPIMIKMSITRGVIQPQPEHDNKIPAPKIVPVTTTFDLPLLTILPINSLGVDTVDINFEMEVKSSYAEQQDDTTQTEIQAATKFELKVGWGPISATVTGNASYDQKDSSTHKTHYQKSNSAKYTVAVHAAQLPVPKGVNTIIEAYTNAIQPLEMPSEPTNGKHGNQ